MMKISKFLFGWSIILIILLSSVRFLALDIDFYHTFYEKMGLAQELGISQTDLDKSMGLMLDYIVGKSHSMDGTIVQNGRVREVYNEKEKQHMVDVKVLYDRAMLTLYGSVGFAVGIPLYWYLKTKDWHRVLALGTYGFLESLLCFGILLTIIGIWIMSNFTDFWIKFHQLFFNNDLWLLDSRTDFMIQICPESMFFQLVSQIVIIVAGVLFLLTLFSLWFIKKKAKIGYGV